MPPFPAPIKKRTAEILRIGPLQEGKCDNMLSAEMQRIFLVDNRGALLRPGMFVEVTLVAERREEVVVAPREAVTERGGKRVVFVLNGRAPILAGRELPPVGYHGLGKGFETAQIAADRDDVLA